MTCATTRGFLIVTLPGLNNDGSARKTQKNPRHRLFHVTVRATQMRVMTTVVFEDAVYPLMCFSYTPTARRCLPAPRTEPICSACRAISLACSSIT